MGLTEPLFLRFLIQLRLRGKEECARGAELGQGGHALLLQAQGGIQARVAFRFRVHQQLQAGQHGRAFLALVPIGVGGRALGVIQHCLAEGGGVHGPQIVAVHPNQLVGVENPRRTVQALHAKERGHFLHAHQLAVISGGPTNKGDEVRQRAGHVARIAVVQAAGIAVALAQLLAVLAVDHRHVHPHRLLPAQNFVQPHVLGRTADPLFTPNHVGDAHQVVIHHRGKVVGRHAVGLDQHRVVLSAAVDFHAPTHRILDHQALIAGHAQPDDARLALGLGRRHLLGGCVAPVATKVARRLLVDLLELAHFG